ncbi:MAG: hypothetical protein ACLRRB_01720 [Ruminococcus sp.]
MKSLVVIMHRSLIMVQNDAERIIIAMGSVTEAAKETIDALTGKRRKGRYDQGASVSSVLSEISVGLYCRIQRKNTSLY